MRFPLLLASLGNKCVVLKTQKEVIVLRVFLVLFALVFVGSDLANARSFGSLYRVAVEKSSHLNTQGFLNNDSWKQLVAGVLASGTIAIASCAGVAMGCSGGKYQDGHYLKHYWKYDYHLPVARSGGVAWHGHRTDMFDQHGDYDQYGIDYTEKALEEYSDRRKWLTPYNYDMVHVIYKDKGVYNNGLALHVGKRREVSVLDYMTENEELIRVAKITGVAFMHGSPYNKSFAVVHSSDILPSTYDFTPRKNTLYLGRLEVLFSNYCGLVRLESYKEDGKWKLMDNYARVISQEILYSNLNVTTP